MINYIWYKHIDLKIKTNLLTSKTFGVNNLTDTDIIYLKNNSIFKKIDKKKMNKVGEFFYIDEKAKILYFERNVGPFKLKFLLKNASELYFNSFYVKFNKYFPSFRRVPTHNHIFTSLFHVKLLKKGYTMIHAAAFSKEDEGIIVSGLSETGKSTTVSLLLAENSDYYYIADDLVFTDGKKLYFNPGTLKPYVLEKIKDKVNKLSSKAAETFKYKLECKPKIAIFLIKSKKEKIREISKEEMLNYLLTSTFEGYYHYMANLVWHTYALVDKDYAPLKLFEKDVEILKDMLNNMDCFVVYGKRPESFKELIKKIL